MSMETAINKVCETLSEREKAYDEAIRCVKNMETLIAGFLGDTP